jgi:hypothetical protein
MNILSWLKRKENEPKELQEAKALLNAIDRGGVPSNPAKVNDIARRLGLDVSRSAPMSETIARIRTVTVRK